MKLAVLVFRPDTGKAVCCVTGTMAGSVATPHSTLSFSCRPMLKSVLKSRFKTRCKSAFRPVLKPAFGSALGPLAAGLLLAVPIMGVPLLAVPRNGLAAEQLHCLTGDELRAATANGKTVPLATVIHTLHRAPKDVIKAKLCQEPDRLIYMLTLLGRDGKVKRAIVDATNGSVVGER